MEPARGKAPGCGRCCLAGLLAGLAAALCLLAYARPGGLRSAACRAAAARPGRARPPLLVLLWTWPFGQRFTPQKCSALYGVPDCRFTANRSRYAAANAIIMHHDGIYAGPERLPQGPRVPSQRWIWFNLESPSHSANLGAMDNLFNLTMSYRRDSDIFSPYGELQLLSQPQPFSIPPKAKLVAWVVSNWRADSHRVKYYEQLRQHIAVDVYGQQHRPLAQDQLLPTMAQYKFYLAFENSQHEDYITEKVWRNALSAGTVPVVLGPPRDNYERFLPPDAFIHVDDFASARDLARYLQELSEDAERYQRYFQWRRWLKPVNAPGWAVHLCRACRVLQTTEARYQVVRDLSAWFV
ncbi:3-galactosyl-N-acetylglucosaminide 4-alpha-L-fucosyltransferase FUT3-like [Struthio camelus]|uniref:3-galactosyl-N-acetylglucosaminide 4-alpha-L-fucosyltransferase FUT3-like n=1 Tax=Struthio camelus TaxID=8801 RepID=UPI0036041EF9